VSRSSAQVVHALCCDRCLDAGTNVLSIWRSEMFRITRHICFLLTLILPAATVSTAPAEDICFVDPAAAEESAAVESAGAPTPHHYRFIVDPLQSQVMVTATVLAQTDTDSSGVTGRLDVTLTPGREPFATIHITDLDLELTGEISLSYHWLFLGDGWVTGTDIGVQMSLPGDQAAVQPDGAFLQAINMLSGRGAFVYDMPTVGAGQVDLADMGVVASDIEGMVSQNGTTITLQSEINIEYPLIIDELQVGTAWIQGTIVATAQVYWSIADLYSDGIVNFRDFAILAAAWASRTGDALYDPICEIHDPPDGVIDARDLAAFAANWLEPTE